MLIHAYNCRLFKIHSFVLLILPGLPWVPSIVSETNIPEVHKYLLYNARTLILKVLIHTQKCVYTNIMENRNNYLILL